MKERKAAQTYDAYHRDYLYKRKYGISVSEYEELLAAQDNSCAVCKGQCSKRLAVDHCHTTGKVRGLLCMKCNRGIGNFNDTPELLEKAAAYLRESYAR